MKKNFNGGFSLLELLISVAIIGVLTTIAVVGLSSTQAGARDGRRKSDLETIRSALELYRADCDRYPTYASGAPSSGQLSFGYALTGTGANTRCATTNTYSPKIPKDINSAYNYVYYVNASGTSYELCSILEKRTSSSPTYDCGTTTSYCGTGIRCYYEVTSP